MKRGQPSPFLSLSFPIHTTMSRCHYFQVHWKLYSTDRIIKIRSPLTSVDVSLKAIYLRLHLLFLLLSFFSFHPTAFYSSPSQTFPAFSLEPCSMIKSISHIPKCVTKGFLCFLAWQKISLSWVFCFIGILPSWRVLIYPSSFVIFWKDGLSMYVTTLIPNHFFFTVLLFCILIIFIVEGITDVPFVLFCCCFSHWPLKAYSVLRHPMNFLRGVTFHPLHSTPFSLLFILAADSVCLKICHFCGRHPMSI